MRKDEKIQIVETQRDESNTAIAIAALSGSGDFTQYKKILGVKTVCPEMHAALRIRLATFRSHLHMKNLVMWLKNSRLIKAHLLTLVAEIT